jgi:transcriptional regulator with XRE-family HTH domain|nr:MAG TPA: helix-turn-helix domain protein [Caudoviricetes sp.]
MKGAIIMLDLKAKRLSLNLTLEEVGKFVGVGKSTVRKWENGLINNMGSDKIQKYAQILQISPLDIINKNVSSKEDKNLQKDIQKLINELDNGMYSKETAEYPEETRELIIFSLETAAKLARKAAKDKFTPNKYKK